MRRNKKPNIMKSKLGMLILVVAVILILLILTGSFHSTKNTLNNESKIINNKSLNQTMDSTNKNNNLSKVEQVVKKTLSEEGLCEDYPLKEGEEINLDNHNIKIERISSKMIKLTIDGEEKFLSEGNSLNANHFLIELKKGNIFYFKPSDPENVVMLRLGCKTENENTNEKYVREKGEVLCKEIYNQCKAEFGLN